MALAALIDIQSGFIFGEWHYPTGGAYGPLQSAYVTLLMIHRGAAKVLFDATERSVVGGECAVIVNRRSLHIHYQKHLKTHVSWCEARPAGAVRGPNAQELDFATKLAISPRLLQLQQLGIGLGLESAATRNELRNAVGLATFAAYLFEDRLRKEQSSIPHGLMRVRRFIDERFASEITLAQLADVAALTPTHLIAAFGKHFGTPPVRYLWSVRASQARWLLLNTGLSSTEIAFRCGYKTPYHFSRHIKQSFGMAPKRLRGSKAYREPSNALEEVSDIAF